jgi:competence protein ComEC
VDPKILLFDVSFHLSFLSVLGIIFVSPYLKKALAFMPNILYIRESLIMTLAAMSFTAPLTWMTFGQFSVVAPLSNLIATPLISPALFFGFFATMVEFISHTIAVWVGFVGWLFLAGILWTIHFFGSFPFAVILLENEPSRFWGPGIYFTMLSLIFLAIELRGRQRTQG